MSQRANASPWLIPSDMSRPGPNNFDAIRLAMALFVVWSHCFAIYFGTEENEPISRLLNGHFNAGNIGVRVFFIISGYLITRSYLHSRGNADYLLKRVRRIYPGFLVATAICTFVVVPLFATAGWALVTPAAIMGWFVRAITLYQEIPSADAFGGKNVNGALWSIRFEFWCYIGVAALGMLRLLDKRRLVLMALCGVILVKCWLDLTGRRPGGGLIELIFGWPYIWFSIAPYFLVGMVAFLYGPRIPRKPALLAGLAAILLASAYVPGQASVLFDLVAPFVFAYIVFYLAFSSRFHLSGVTRFGDLSYGVYLYGFPVQLMVKAELDLSFPAYMAACMALSVGAGMLSWNVVEKWFLRKSKPRSSATTGAVPSAMQPEAVERLRPEPS